MRKVSVVAFILATAWIAVSSAPDVFAQGKWQAYLRGLEGVPAVSNLGPGFCRLEVNQDGAEIQYELSYQSTVDVVSQAHLDFGQKGVNGGVRVFPCSNLLSAPPGIPACPASGPVAGAFPADNVIGLAAQEIEPGELGKVMGAIRLQAAYVNVHSDAFPLGELRRQIRRVN